MKTKYAVPWWLVEDLVAAGLADGEEDAMVKVASGEALDPLLAEKNERHSRLLRDLRARGGRDVDLAEEIDYLGASIEKLDQLIKTREETE